MRRLSLHGLAPSGLGASILAMLTGWLAVRSWRGLVESPEHFIWPTLACGVLIVVAGTLARTVRVPWPLVPLVEALVCALFVNRHYAPAASWHGWVPTRASVDQVYDTAHAGAVAINTYAAPVSADRPESYLYLLVGAVGILLAIDVLACGLQKVPLAALPVLLALSIPISVLDRPLSGFEFVATALAFLLLLSTVETRRVLGWGRAVAGRGSRWDSFDQVVHGGSVRTAAVRIGVVTTVGALLVPLFVPVAGDLFGLRKQGPGPGLGSSHGVQTVNPLVDLRRDLVRNDHTPLVYVNTRQADPSYLRTTVLDDFNGSEWRPSTREVPTINRASGPLPSAPGLLVGTPGAQDRWAIRLDPAFETRWLPTPYPASEVDVSGDWRYDNRTMDIVNADDKRSSRGLSYSAVAFEPRIDASALASAAPPPSTVAEPMTGLPRSMPGVIADKAREITAGGSTDFERAVLLQDWFRSKGGFVYSTDPAPGSGMRQLARFITTDKVGYCEQFAAAMAVMGRTLGIPSRVAVGFLRPERLTGNRYMYTTDNLHAWPEMYFTGAGWVRLEPTPGTHTGTSPAYTRQKITGTATSAPQPTARPSLRLPVDPNRGAANSKTSSEDGGSPVSLPLVALVLLVLLLSASPRLLRDARRRSRLEEARDPSRLAAGARAELSATAADLGIALPVQRSLRTWAAALTRRIQPDLELRRDLDAFVEFAERAHYGRPFEVDTESRALVLRTVEQWSEALVGSVRPRKARLARIFPRSVWTDHQSAVEDPRSDSTQVGEKV